MEVTERDDLEDSDDYDDANAWGRRNLKKQRPLKSAKNRGAPRSHVFLLGFCQRVQQASGGPLLFFFVELLYAHSLRRATSVEISRPEQCTLFVTR